MSREMLKTKEIYRTPGYRSRGNSFDSSSSPKAKEYKADFTKHKRLKTPQRFESPSGEFQKNDSNSSSRKWINETDEQQSTSVVSKKNLKRPQLSIIDDEEDLKKKSLKQKLTANKYDDYRDYD